MNTGLRITLDDGRARSCAPYAPVGRLLDAPAARGGLPVIGARVNHEIVGLDHPLAVNARVAFLTMADPQGMRMYRDSLAFLLRLTADRLFPGGRLTVEHSLGTGLFCLGADARGRPLAARQVAALESAMRRAAADRIPIRRLRLSFAEALRRLQKAGRSDTLGLLRYRNPPSIAVHVCGRYLDLAHGPLAPDTGALPWFRLIHYPPGLVLQLPTREAPRGVAPFRDQPHLFAIFHEYRAWGRVSELDAVGQLNDRIVNGGIREFMRVEEAFHEKKIAGLADRIRARRGVRLILISGPSSAGKTTLAKRLAVQLEVSGVKTETLSLDNYYKDDADTPPGEDGRPDYEHLEALDLALFNRHLVSLIAGRPVQLPRFDFELKRRSGGRPLRLAPGQVMIIEGIHALNPRLTARVPARQKFGLYVSALTQLALDGGNRIATTDNRLLRRLVRDQAFRNNSPLDTFRLWPSVRRGEKRWVFPFQTRADAAFNSALDYELAVLKPLAEPLLMQIKPTVPEYAEARRLQGFLSNFLAIPRTDVPPTSILREYIGASSFQY